MGDKICYQWRSFTKLYAASLRAAARGGHIQILKFLLSKCRVRHPDEEILAKFERTLTESAAAGGYRRTLEWLQAFFAVGILNV